MQRRAGHNGRLVGESNERLSIWRICGDLVSPLSHQTLPPPETWVLT